MVFRSILAEDHYAKVSENDDLEHDDQSLVHFTHNFNIVLDTMLASVIHIRQTC